MKRQIQIMHLILILMAATACASQTEPVVETKPVSTPMQISPMEPSRFYLRSLTLSTAAITRFSVIEHYRVLHTDIPDCREGLSRLLPHGSFRGRSRGGYMILNVG